MLPFPVDPENDTICDVIRRWAVIQPDAPAFLGEGREPLTYSALVEAMDGIGADLDRAGFGRGDRIALVHTGGQPMACLVLGIIGRATLLPLDPNQTAAEIETDLLNRRADALILEQDASPAAREAAEAIGTPVFSPAPSCDGLRTADGGPLPAVAAGGEHGLAEAGDAAIVLPTSGTTSTPKLILFHHRLALLRALSENRFFDRNPADICLCPQRLYYANGLNQMMSSLTCGSTLALAPAFTAETFFSYLREFGLTCVSASVPFLHRIHESFAAFQGQGRAHSLRYIRATSGFLDPTVAAELEDFFGVPIVENYSSSETCRICCNPLPPAVCKHGTVGPPSDCEVRIRALDGYFLPDGERGEVVVRGERIIEGYENDAQASGEAFVDGWFRTGDEGFLDEDGYLTLTGRIKEMINRGGEKVSPAEVDAAVMEHPGVREAATFPVPHPTLGEEVALAVVRASGTAVTESDLSTFLLARLAGFKVPRRIVFVDKIPKSDAGKVQRYTLAEALGVSLDPNPDQTRVSDRRPSTLEYRLQKLWAKALRVRQVGLDDNFFLLGGDSLQAVDLFLDIERSFKQRLPLAALFEAGTVAEMALLIDDKKMEPQGAIVPIQPEGDRPPFFCIHGVGGEAISHYHLSQHLGDDQPFYGIQSVGWDVDSIPFTKATDMAAHYVSEIRKIQPQGPYFIGGQSFGGRIAIYMGQQLREAGEEVALLVLFDTVSLAGRRFITLGQWIENQGHPNGAELFQAVMRYIRVRLRNSYQSLYYRALRSVLFPVIEYYRASGKSMPLPLYRPDRCNRLMRLELRNMPPYEGDAVYFKAETPDQSMYHSDTQDSWNRIIKGKLTYIPVSGTHHWMLREPHARSLAQKLSRELERAR